MWTVTALVVAILVAITAAEFESDANITVTLTPTANNVTEGNSFIFLCNSSVSVTYMSLIIDNTNSSPKFDRVTAQPLGNNAVQYTFNQTMYTDNSTVFMCKAINGSMEYDSDDFYLDVLYVPKLVQGNNMINLTELEQGKDHILPFTLLSANPPITGITTNNDSTNSTGVSFTNNTDSANITFSPSYPSNRGNYTVTFTNPIGSTFFTYRTYIGGVPNDLNISCNLTHPSGRAVIECSFTDNSDAPATGVNITVGDINSINMTFDTVPATGVMVTALDMSLAYIYSGNYTLNIVAFNQLGSMEHNESLFIDGFKTDVFIEGLNASVTERNNFTFTCFTPNSTYTNFTPMVNDLPNSPNVTPLGPAVNGSQSFVFMNASWLDNGTILQCKSNNTWSSPLLFLDVLFAPKFMSNHTITPYLINGTQMQYINITVYSNPIPSKHDWMHNDKPLRNGIHSSLEGLNFSVVQLNDTGNYSVFVENEIGNETLTFTLDIYYVPFFNNKSITITKVEGEKLELSVNASAQPPITGSQWMNNGTIVDTTDRVIIGLLNITINELHKMDNNKWTLNVSNDIGYNIYPFTLDVLYGPTVISETQSGYIGSSFTLSVEVDANPMNCTAVWMKDGNVIEKQDGVTPTNSSIIFKSLDLSSDNGTYSINITNGIGAAVVDTVDLAIYFGPVFKEYTNETVWMEYATDSNATFSCVVIGSYPPVNLIDITAPAHTNESNWSRDKDGNISVTVHITKASQQNRDNYTCMASNGKITTATIFQTFVGGAPDKTTVKVNHKQQGSDDVVFSIIVTDSSEAPPREIIFTNPADPGKNKTLTLPQPLINGLSYINETFFTAKYSDLQSGRQYMILYSSNSLGSIQVKNYTISGYTPTTTPQGHKSKTTAIVAGILVPLAVIILVACIGGGVYYYMKKRKTGGFSPLKTVADDGLATQYGTTNS